MILNCGEALIDMVAQTLPDGHSAYVPHPGGAVLNTAVALGRLGVTSSFLAGLSEDLFAADLKTHMQDSNVTFELCPHFDAPTTLAFVQLVDSQARYAFFDENTALRNLSVSDLPAIPQDTSALFFGGISLAYGTCADAYEHLMVTSSTDHVTMIDPNIRPGFIRDEVSYRARLDRMLAVADIVKLSDEDLSWLEGEGPMDAAAKAILARGAKLVFITQGSKGATAFHANFQVFCPATPVDLTDSDTIGAGDTFNAGVLAALFEAGALDKSILTDLPEATAEAAVTLGMASAAVTVSRKGANPPWRSELSL
ncbi:MAG: carbohydrate kinase [Aliishimia sp.]